MSQPLDLSSRDFGAELRDMRNGLAPRNVRSGRRVKPAMESAVTVRRVEPELELDGAWGYPARRNR